MGHRGPAEREKGPAWGTEVRLPPAQQARCSPAHPASPASRDARDHGVKSVGLPSRLASFRALPPLPAVGPGGGGGGRAKGSRLLKQHECSWWDTAGAGGAGARCTGSPPTAEVELLNSEARGLRSQLARLLPWRRRRGRLCTGLASPVASFEVPRWRTAWAPRVQMFLPSFRCRAALACARLSDRTPPASHAAAGPALIGPT